MNKKFLLITIFLLVAANYVYSDSFLMDRVVAVVNQDVITWSELYRTMELDANPQVKALNEAEKNRIFRENESVFLETLINYKLQLQEAQSLGIKVGDDEIKDAMESIRKKFSMNDEQFKQFLKAEGYSLQEYNKRLHEQIMINKLVNQQVRKNILLTDNDVDRFIKEDKNFNMPGENYHLKIIFLKKHKTDAENITVLEKAKQIYDNAIKGEDFSALASKYSEDPSKDNGGDLGFIERNNLAKEFVAELSTMKPGDISRPFQISTGTYIIKLEEKTAPLSASEVKEEAKKQLSDKLFRQKYEAWLKGLREKSFIDIRL